MRKQFMNLCLVAVLFLLGVYLLSLLRTLISSDAVEIFNRGVLTMLKRVIMKMR